MKRILLIVFTSLSFGLYAQSPMLNDVVRSNPASSRFIANALDVLKPAPASGTNTYTASILSGVLYAGSATYVDGDMFTIVFANANSSTTVTLNINSEGAIAVKDNDGTDPDVGAIAGALQLRYNGTHFRVVGATGGGGAGTVTDVLGTTNRITSSGGTTPTIDISANFEAMLSKVAQRIDQNNAATTSAQLASILSDEEGSSGGFVRATSPTLTTPNLGTPSAINLTNATGLTETFVVAVSDETTSIPASAGKVTFRMPRARTLTGIKASLITAQTSGSIFTVDVNESGTTILSTKLTIDNSETTSVTAATAPVISDSSLADDAVITIDVDQVGSGTATGLKLTFIWN